MKIAVIAANGKSGQRIVEEALSNGLDVTAIVRKENRSKANQAIIKDIFDLTAEDLSSFDAVVDAFGMFDPNHLDQHYTSIKHLIEILSGSKTRLYVVGGAGSLYVDNNMSVQLKDTPDFPDAFKPLAESMSRGLELLKSSKNIHWVYISPAADFDSEGPKTNDYAFAGEQLMINAEGKSYISYADYASALVEQIKSSSIDKKRISVYKK
ncbi:NAD(P)-dependent oxidoreductase [Leuconostoc palmae]|uniref:NAD(P)-dependent oxidoreductase n=1 Tax=Leuconostoc palmae TaxID=501487 RepID=UPI001C7D1A65|nr:NAD(P)H-binding protein [Leuconostoc palmae]